MYKDKERYLEYQRNYYRAHRNLKYDAVLNSLKKLDVFADKMPDSYEKLELYYLLKDLSDSLIKVISKNYKLQKDLINFFEKTDSVMKNK